MNERPKTHFGAPHRPVRFFYQAPRQSGLHDRLQGMLNCTVLAAGGGVASKRQCAGKGECQGRRETGHLHKTTKSLKNMVDALGLEPRTR